jgi:predicted DNA-binding transcriptional regulator AlpA
LASKGSVRTPFTAGPSSRENQPVDVREAASLYESGHTIAEVAAILHVTPRTVVRNFEKAGIARRRRGTLPRVVPVSEIQRLRDKGLTMPQVAEALGITTSLAWRRYRRRQPVSDGREAPPSTSMSSGLGRWQAALIDALSQEPVIAVNYAVALHLGREPTHVELVAAQRAAHRLTEQYQVRIAHVSPGRVTSRGAAVIAREDRTITDKQLVRAARKRLPMLREQPPSPVADQLIDDLASALTAAATAARALANHHLDDAHGDNIRRVIEGLYRDLARVRRLL